MNWKRMLKHTLHYWGMIIGGFGGMYLLLKSVEYAVNLGLNSFQWLIILLIITNFLIISLCYAEGDYK